MKLPLVLFLSWTVMGYVTTQVTSTDNSTATTISARSDTTLTIFLLERDIPMEIKRLGVVNIAVGTGAVDKSVKEKLKQKCQELGANGAYLISDGFYPSVGLVPYLIFKYKK